MNRKGFTLIEVMAVVIIIGVIMMIAIPSVSSYIANSKKSSYATNIHAYIETIRAEYEERNYGPILEDNEIMIVPIKVVKLEKGDAGSSPFGAYNYDKSYVVISPERNTYEYYANVVDSTKKGVIMTKYNELSGDKILEDATSIPEWSIYNGTSTIYTINSKNYLWCDSRESEVSNEENTPILVLCEE